MDPFFQELKRTREAKQISLSDIADITLINVRFLEAIEQGNVSILPQTYIRAFIREYATVIGLDPEQALRKYEAAVAGGSLPAAAEPRRTSGPEVAAIPVPKEGKPSWFTGPRVLVSAGVGIALIAALFFFLSPGGGDAPKAVEETPFQSVLKETTQRLPPPPALQRPVEQAKAAPVPSDSLTLRAAISDSLWIRMAVDQEPPREYLFRPNTRISWKARDRFTLTLGNAGNVEFTLNQTPLGALGPRGSVLRNVEISRRNLAAH